VQFVFLELKYCDIEKEKKGGDGTSYNKDE